MTATAEQMRAILGPTYIDSTPASAVKYTLLEDGQRWFAETTCPRCNSSLTSGDWLPSMRAALAVAREGFATHKQTWGASCTPHGAARMRSAATKCK